MEYKGKFYDLQEVLFEYPPCVGCEFAEEVNCYETIGSSACSEGGNGIWQRVGENGD